MERFAVLLVLVGCSEPFKPGTDAVVDDSGTTPGDSPTTTTTDSEAPASVTLLTPGDFTVSPATLTASVTGSVESVGYSVGGVTIGESTDAASGFAVTWAATAMGTQTVTAHAYDAIHSEVATDDQATRITDLGRENHLGVWLTDIDTTLYTHETLAATLAPLGVKRVYVQIGEDFTNCDAWPEACDPAIPAAYHAQGLEVFAWSKPNATTGGRSASMLTFATDIEYDGFVMYLTAAWDGLTQDLEELGKGYADAREVAVENRRAFEGWPLYTTTEPDVTARELRVDLLDNHVDGFLPRVFVEEDGRTADPAVAIAEVVCDFVAAGVTKPVHPIGDSRTGELDAAGIDAFLAAAGTEGSLWLVPDLSDETILALWAEVDWDAAGYPDAATCP